MTIPLFTLKAGTKITSKNYDGRGSLLIGTSHPDDGCAIYSITPDGKAPNGVRIEKTCTAPNATATLTVGHQK